MADEKNEVYHVIAYWFEGQDRAEQVLDVVKNNAGDAGLKVKAWAVVSVDTKGKARVKQTSKRGLGAGMGAGAGVLLGLIGGPAGLLLWTLGGAALGGLAGKQFGSMIPEDQLKMLGAAMEPNSSAVMVVIEDKAAAQMNDALGKQGAKVVTLTLGDQATGELIQVSSVDLGADAEKDEEAEQDAGAA